MDAVSLVLPILVMVGATLAGAGVWLVTLAGVLETAGQEAADP